MCRLVKENTCLVQSKRGARVFFSPISLLSILRNRAEQFLSGQGLAYGVIFDYKRLRPELYVRRNQTFADGIFSEAGYAANIQLIYDFLAV